MDFKLNEDDQDLNEEANGTESPSKFDSRDKKKKPRIPEGASLNKAINEDQLDELDLLDQFEIDPTEEIEAPPEALRMNGETIGTLGNFSLLLGKAKSRKSFLCALLSDAAIRSQEELGSINGMLPEGETEVIYIDTEQGRYHANKQANRIYQLSQAVENIHYFALRKMSTEKRFWAIERTLKKYPNSGLLILDGVRDIAKHGINDEETATEICDLLLRLSEEFNTHIISVLHQNKNDQNARGHLGTELVNKSETVISVQKDSNDREVSFAEAEFTRNKEPEPLVFTVYDNLPEILLHWDPSSHKEHPNKKKRPEEIPEEIHRDIINTMKHDLEGVENVNRDDLLFILKDEVKEKVEGTEVGDKIQRSYLRFYKDKGAITHDKKNGFRVVGYPERSQDTF